MPESDQKAEEQKRGDEVLRRMLKTPPKPHKGKDDKERTDKKQGD